jgi:hypothetical protein
MSTCVEPAARALGEAYAERIAALVDGAPPLNTSPRGAHGRVFLDLVAEALDDGLKRKRIARETTSDAPRMLRVDDALDEAGNGALALTADGQRRVDALLAAYAPHAPDGYRVLDAVRRYGRGVASMPAERYVVLWDRGDDGPEDDALWMFREVVDTTPVPGLFAPVDGVFASAISRVPDATVQLWADDDLDGALAGVSDGAMSFKVQSWNGFQQGFDHEHIAGELESGRLDEDDVIAFARFLGELLADAHARARTATGEPGLLPISEDLDGDVEALGDELLMVVRHDLPRVRRWYAAFLGALEDLGPLLGAEALWINDVGGP